MQDPATDQEQFVLVVMMVPYEFAPELDAFHVLAVELVGDMRIPAR
jgi:hypothetical protein